MPETFEILERIDSKYPQLSPNARLIANFLQQQPLALLSLSMAELASATNTSKATVSRFFRQLGYQSHQEARQTLSQLRHSGVPLQDIKATTGVLDAELDNLRTTFDSLDEQRLDTVAQAIADAPAVTLFGYRNSYPVAMHCRQQLIQIRPKVRLLPQPGQSVGEDLLDIDKEQFVIVMGFRRRPRGFGKLIERLADHKTLLLTDPSGQIYNQKVDHLLVCQLGQHFAFDSYAAPMSLVSVLCNKVYQRVGSNASTRATAISSLYEGLDEIESE